MKLSVYCFLFLTWLSCCSGGILFKKLFSKRVKFQTYNSNEKLQDAPAPTFTRKTTNALKSMQLLAYAMRQSKYTGNIRTVKSKWSVNYIVYPQDYPDLGNIGYVNIKEYRPELFQQLRENAGISIEQYVEDLQSENLHFLFNRMDSKSKQYFWKSINHFLLIKTIKQYESCNLKEILSELKMHILYENADSVQEINSTSTSSSSSIPINEKLKTSCLGNVLGLYKVSIYSKFGFLISHKHFIVLKNIFQPNSLMNNYFYQQPPSSASPPLLSQQPSLFYDLKGSFIGRKKSNSSLVYKDLDFLEQNQLFILGEEGKQLLLETLRHDCQFLEKSNFMDYSLLVEIDNHNNNNINPSSSGLPHFSNLFRSSSSSSWKQNK
jgi:hypothetical protein